MNETPGECPTNNNTINIEVYILIAELTCTLLLGIFTSYKLDHLKIIVDHLECCCCFECDGVSISE